MAETIGSLVDKISILELKVFHMQEQVQRGDATVEHQKACEARLVILKQQQADLRQELNQLSKDVLDGKKELKVYRQFKMYNDPSYSTKS